MLLLDERAGSAVQQPLPRLGPFACASQYPVIRRILWWNPAIDRCTRSTRCADARAAQRTETSSFDRLGCWKGGVLQSQSTDAKMIAVMECLCPVSVSTLSSLTLAPARDSELAHTSFKMTLLLQNAMWSFSYLLVCYVSALDNKRRKDSGYVTQ